MISDAKTQVMPMPSIPSNPTGEELPIHSNMAFEKTLPSVKHPQESFKCSIPFDSNPTPLDFQTIKQDKTIQCKTQIDEFTVFTNHDTVAQKNFSQQPRSVLPKAQNDKPRNIPEKKTPRHISFKQTKSIIHKSTVQRALKQKEIQHEKLSRKENFRNIDFSGDNIPTPTPFNIKMSVSKSNDEKITDCIANPITPPDEPKLHPTNTEQLKIPTIPKCRPVKAVPNVNLRHHSMPSMNNQSTPAEIEVGSIVDGKYEILSEISSGGFGIVYKARQIGVNRIVALKRLRSQSDPLAHKRFLLEANIIKHLIHPNTIQLIDAVIENSHLYLIMEYIEGKSLHSILSNHKPFTIHRTLNITRQILKSINEAHQRGIIHRDLKPSNILIRNVIGEPDFVKVLDFGVAKAKNADIPKLTQEGNIIGTPQYLAPELLFGEEAGPGADLYSVGLIMAEMLTGQTIMPNDISAIIHLAETDSPIPIPGWLFKSNVAEILIKSLEKDPAKRYQSAMEMLEDIRKLETSLAYEKLTTPTVPIRTSRRIDVTAKTSHRMVIFATLLLITNVFLILHLFVMR